MTALKDELEKALKENNIELLKEKIDQLEKAAQAMAEAMYQQEQQKTQSEQAPNGAESSESEVKDDNVMDADFKEKQ